MREAEMERPASGRPQDAQGIPSQSPAGAAVVRPGTRRVFHPLIELTLIRMREFTREREAVFWVFIFPILLAFALGIAFRNTPADKTPVAVAAASDQQDDAAKIAAALGHSADVRPVLLSLAEAERQLRTGKVAMLVLPGVEPQSQTEAAGSQEMTGSGARSLPPRGSYEYRYDPTRPDSRMARLLVDDALERASGRLDVISARDQKVEEPGARYIDFLIPGLIGFNLMGSGIWGLGFSVVQARGRKLLKRFAATPMHRSHYLLSYILSRLLFLSVEVAAVITFGWIVFGVAVRGSILSVALISILGGFTFSALGLLLASRAQTIEGISGLMNLIMLPMWLLSGTFFSSSRFPQVLQPLVKALPLTAVNDSLRAVMNEGSPLSSTWPALAVLLFWCVVCSAVALRIFRWQ